MSRQDTTFLNSEGDRWYKRNLANSTMSLEERGQHDVVLPVLKTLSLRPQRTLEIGCSDGWRLALIQRDLGGDCHGLEPSAAAITEGARRFAHVYLLRGNAATLPYRDNLFDLVLLPGVLYLCDRDQLFRIASEVDRVLADGGYLAIADFTSPCPYRNAYVHHPGLYSYKMAYRRMFDWNPAYVAVYSRIQPYPGSRDLNDPDTRYAVDVLRKDLASAYPDNPFRPLAKADPAQPE